MENLASAFSGLPYFSPMMMMNTSETDASRRLFQCTDFGVSMNDITKKFMRDPEDAPDLERVEFLARKRVVEEVAAWCEEMEVEVGEEGEGKGKGKEEFVYRNEWTPILYKYEIVKSSAKRERDWGHLIFTDGTISRFLLVMVFLTPCNCGNLSHDDYDALTKYHADRFMSLITYLHEEWKWGNSPSWVRATYTTPKQNLKLDSAFIGSSAPTPANPSFPPIFHVTASSFHPTLLSSELEKIDNVAAQGKKKRVVEGNGGSAGSKAREHVLSSNPKGEKPDVGKAWMARNARQCGYCQEVKSKDLQKCSRCKLVFYCGAACQRMAWPSHKHFCKKAD